MDERKTLKMLEMDNADEIEKLQKELEDAYYLINKLKKDRSDFLMKSNKFEKENEFIKSTIKAKMEEM